MTSIAIVFMYLSVATALGAAIGLSILIVDGAFYAFCWTFGKLDQILQEKHWDNLRKLSVPVENQENNKKAA